MEGCTWVMVGIHVLMFIHVSDHFERFRGRNVTGCRGWVVFRKINPDRGKQKENEITHKGHKTEGFLDQL